MTPDDHAVPVVATPPRRRRLRRIAAVLVSAAVALLGGMIAASPASAAATVCHSARAGWGGLDTVKVCTIVEVHDVIGTVSYFTSSGRAGPRDVWLDTTLYNDFTPVASSGVVECGPISPGAKCEVDVFYGANPPGGQRWNTIGDWTADHVGQITSGSVQSPNNWG
jgi:hypothetical protein